MDEVHKAYDHYELSAKQALREVFRFGPQRIARFEEAFSEASSKECERIRAELRKKQRG
jgi:hypothetical protein